VGEARVLLLGATGTIGQASARALVRAGHSVVCVVRPRSDRAGVEALLPGTEVRFGDVTDPASLARDGIKGEAFDAVVSCLASRTGAPKDAWAIDYEAHSRALGVVGEAGVPRFVLLSALCVQQPKLAFQHAKLAFEAELMGSGLDYAIVRPTAFFKSLSGQVERVRAGKSYLMFGDGTLTSCKPISDDDLGDYLAACVTGGERRNKILPIGGPGPAVTPREQGEKIFELLQMPPRFRSVSPRLLDGIVGVLSALGKVSPAMADKAELARIGRYYALHPMLVWDAAAGRYDADATPSTGHETLYAFYGKLVRGEASVARGDHAVF